MAIVPTGDPVKVTRYNGAPGLGGSVSGKAPAQRQVPGAKPVRVRQPKAQGKTSKPTRAKPTKVVPIQGEPKNENPFTKPATNGRTPVTATSVVGSKPPAPPKPPVVAGAPPLTPEQQAQQAVAAALAPQYASQQSDAAARNAAIQQFTQALMSAVGGMPSQYANLVNPQIQGQADLAASAANALKGANPNQQDQQMLAFLNAPDSQRSNTANLLNNTFNGGAAVGLYTGGVLPTGTLRSQALGDLAQLSQLPGLEGLRGQQTFAQALQQEAQAKQAIDAQQPGLVQQYLQQYTSAQNDAADRAEKIREFNVSQGNTNAYRAGLLANDKAKNTLAAGKQSWQQTYQSGLLSLRRSQIINEKQYQKLSLALRGKSLDSANYWKSVNAALKQNGSWRVGGSDKTGRFLYNPQNPAAPKIPFTPPVNTSKATPANPFPNLSKSQQQHLRAGIANAFYGIKKQDSKDGKDHPPLLYEDAINHAVQSGYSRAAAVRMANRFYMPGQHGRPKGDAAQGAAFSIKGATAKDAAAVNLVKDYLGTPYVWGGTSPKGFDCSGLLQYTWGKLGVQIPRTTYTQWQAGTAVNMNQLRPGDAVFFKGSDSRGGLPGHVGMYIGNGRFIEAPHSGATVRISNLAGYPGYMGARRYA